MLKFKSLEWYFVAIFVALVWILIILFYTRGGLLIGGDLLGSYNAYTAIQTGNPNAILPGICLLLANGNIYIGFYVWLFTGACLNLIAFSYFLSTLFDDWRGKLTYLFIADILYAFGVFRLYDTFKSVIGLAFTSTAGLLLFLALAVKLYRHASASCSFTKVDCVLMGLGIAVSSTVPPNSFRILLLEGILVIGLSFLALIKNAPINTFNGKAVFKRVLYKLPIIGVVATLGMLYWEFPFFSSFGASVETASFAVQAQGLYGFNAPYAILINTFRMLGAWTFPSMYCPYHDLYSHNPIITITSFIWPVTAMGLSFMLADRNRRSKILMLVAISLLIITWDTANNAPVGVINTFIVSHLPIVLGFFPTFFLSSMLLQIFFAALSSYAVVRVIELLRKSKQGVSHSSRKNLEATLPIILIIVLLIPAAPLFTGSALGQYFDPSIKGMTIPKDYFDVKSILSSSTQSETTTLLWPSVVTYVQTSWGFQGSNGFYNSFFSPIRVYTPDIFATGLGGYTLANPELAAEYSNMTLYPLMPSSPLVDITGYADFSKLSVWGARYTYSDSTIKLSPENSGSDHIDVLIPFHEALDASGSAFFMLEFSAEPMAFIENMLRNGSLWVGISCYEGTTGWYLLGSSPVSSYRVSDSTILVSMLVGFPDKPWVASTYNSSSVTGFVFRIFSQELSNSPYEDLLFSSVSIKVSSGDIDPSKLDLWARRGVKYVIFDSSIIDGAAIPSEQYSLTTKLLIDKGIFIQIFAGKYIQLYKVNYGNL